MQIRRLEAWLKAAQNVFGVKYKFVRVVGLNQEERFYLADSVTTATSNLKLKQDLGEDNFSVLFAKNMTVEEIIDLNRRKRFPLLNEELWIKVSCSKTSQTFVHLLGPIGAKLRKLQGGEKICLTFCRK